MTNDRRIASFLLLSFGSTWGIAGVGAYSGIRASSGISYMLLAATCMLMPAVAAIVQQRLFDRAPWTGLGISLKGMDWKFLAVTGLVGMVIVPLMFGVLFLLGDVMGISAFGHVSISSERMLISLQELIGKSGQAGVSSTTLDAIAGVPAVVILVGGLLAAVFAACTINLPFMLGEELGWRGYLFQALATWTPLRRVLFTGIVWGLWHAPLILMGHNYPDHPVAGIGLMLVFCVLLAFLFDWSRTRVKAVWGPCVLHGIINGSAGLFALFAWDGQALVASPVGVGGFIALALIGSVLVLLDNDYRAGLMDDRSRQVAGNDPH